APRSSVGRWMGRSPWIRAPSESRLAHLPVSTTSVTQSHRSIATRTEGGRGSLHLHAGCARRQPEDPPSGPDVRDRSPLLLESEQRWAGARDADRETLVPQPLEDRFDRGEQLQASPLVQPVLEGVAQEVGAPGDGHDGQGGPPGVEGRVGQGDLAWERL